MGARPNMRVQRTRSASLRSPLTRGPLGRGCRWLACVVLLAGCCSIGCSRSDDIPVSQLPPELVVPQGASDVVARGNGKTTVVSYRASVSYPAEGFLAEVGSRLEQRGWKAMEVDLMNPTIPSSNVRGWTSFIDGQVSPPAGAHLWLGGWKNQEGDVVQYSLRYSSALGNPGQQPLPPQTPDLRVNAFLIPAQQTKAMVAEAKRVTGK